jgi:hypothetical protein
VLKRVITAAVGVVGLVLVGLGVASATAWRADDVLVATTQVGAHTYVTDPGVLELGGNPATVRVTAPGKGHVVLAVGRDTDVAGWVGTDAHARVTGLSSWHTLEVKSVAAKPAPAPTDSPAAADAAGAATAEPSPAATADAPAAPKAADPTGSDLWVAQSAGDGSATLKWSAEPGRWSLIAVSTGDSAPTLEISWPRVVTTPWLWPLVVTGIVLFLAALFVFLWDERRRHRGEEALWVPVTTGALPAVGVGPEPLTRRQVREAARAHATALAQGRPSAAPAPTERPAPDVRAGDQQTSPVFRPLTNHPGATPHEQPGPVPGGNAARPAADAPTPGHPAEPAPVTAPTSRRALRAAATPSAQTAPTRPSGPVPTGPSTSAALGGPGAGARPTWVPIAPTPDEPRAPEGRPTAGTPASSAPAHPRWLGTGAGAPVGPTAPARPEAGAEQGPALPPPAPQRPPGPAATENAEESAGSRADAWRRAGGLPPIELDDTPRGEGRHGR